MNINAATPLPSHDLWLTPANDEDIHAFASSIRELAFQCMVVEVRLTPKPGLVDTLNNGAHRDMTLALFEKSAAAISPYLSEFVTTAFRHHHCKASELLALLRPIGLEAEQAMYDATKGVNTHKGMIFSLGIICGAIGWLKANSITIDALHISKTVKASTETGLWAELKAMTRHAGNTMGEKLYLDYGITGARGEVASGFQTVVAGGLPVYQSCIELGYAVEPALWQTLLVLMANNQDTNLIARGGLDGLKYVRNRAASLLRLGGIREAHLRQHLMAFDRDLITRNLSPGGSADLLAVTWFLAELERLLNAE